MSMGLALKGVSRPATAARSRPAQALSPNGSPYPNAYEIYSLEFQFDFEAVPAKEGHRIGYQPLLDISIAIELRLRPVAVLNVCGTIRVRVVLILLLVFTCLIVTYLDFHVERFQIVKVRIPALLEEPKVLLFRIELVRFVQTRQILHLKLARVQLRFVCIGSKVGAIGELIAFPKR